MLRAVIRGITTMRAPARPPHVRVLPRDRDTDQYRALVSEAAQSLKAGKVVALPTDTIYGLAALAQVRSVDPHTAQT